MKSSFVFQFNIYHWLLQQGSLFPLRTNSAKGGIIPPACRECHISSYAKNGVKVIYFYFENDVVVDDVVSRLKKIARRLLVTIVLMIDVVGTRYGIEEKQPCLQDLSWCQLDEYSDIVIGFLNCDSFGYVSEDGIDIKGQMRFQVVKDRYNKQHEHFYLSVLAMTMKQFSDTSLYSSMHQDHHQR